MRKLLLGTTALAAAGAIATNTALADVSISAASEFRYISRSSEVTANDGTSFETDTEIAFSFSNKTDSGLDIGMTVEMTADGGDSTIDESSVSIAGGFGKIVLGQNDAVGDNYGIEAADLIAEEHAITITSATISTDSDMAGTMSDATKVSYHFPAMMGGLTAGVSLYDSGAASTADSTEWGAQYSTEMGGSSVTIGAAAATTEATTKDIDERNVGVKIVSGNLSFIMAEGSYEANDEDRTNRGVAVSYNMGDGMTVGAYSFSSTDAADADEELDKQGAELQYTIASGLTAVITLENYEYDAGTSETTVSDDGMNSKLTIKAADRKSVV